MSATSFKIAADENIPYVAQACGELGQVQLFDMRNPQAVEDAIARADVLLCRSTVRIDAELLEKSSVRFVATATSGTDHLDLDWLDDRGISWAAAAGSNARSVAEWIAAVLLELHHRGRTELVAADVGIVGVGHVGEQVADVARALGLRAVLNDPPRESRGEQPLAGSDIPFSSLDEVLHCRILTLHTPLTSSEPHPTRRLIGERRLSMLPDGATVINASRGEVLDAESAAAWRRWKGGALALDVFPGEPGIDPALVAVADIATPHVAGHSLDGKLLGTQMVHDALCRFLDVRHTWNHEDYLPVLDGEILQRDEHASEAESPFAELRDVVLSAVPLLRDDRALGESMQYPHQQRADSFKTLRATYPGRREFRCFRISKTGFSAEAAVMLEALGFQLD